MNIDLIISEYERLIYIRVPANSRKLGLLFQKWINDYQIALDDSRSVPNNCIDLFAEITQQDNTNFKKVIRKRSRGIFKDFIWYIAKWMPLKIGVVSGGITRYFDRLRFIITKAKIDSVQWEIDNAFRDKFLSSIKPGMDNKSFKLLSDALPDIFFCKIKTNTNILPKSYIGSISVFSAFDMIKILFVKNYVEFTNIVHGGYYGEFSNNLIEKFETNCADFHFDWGLGHQNVRQNRFVEIPPLNKIAYNVNWVGNAPLNCYTKKYFEGYELIFNESTDILLENYPRLSSKVPITFLQHPREFIANEQFNRVRKFASLTKYEKDNSLLVIDSPGSTIMYMAIYQNIPFILIYKRAWRQFFPVKYLEFLDFLEKESLILYWDDNETVFNYFSKISKGVPFPGSLFQKCRNWLENS